VCLSKQLLAIVRRRFARPFLERPIESGRIRKVQQVGELGNAQARMANVSKREPATHFIEKRGVSQSLRGKLALQGPRAHVERLCRRRERRQLMYQFLRD